MDVKTLCLGLLSLGDASGYDLKKQFETVLRPFFTAGYGSIYPALADLAADGLVECREEQREGKPDRKVYSITPEGRAKFRRALHRMNPRHRLRSEFLAMLFFADLMDNDRLEEVMDERLEKLRGASAETQVMSDAWGENTPAGARFVAGFGAALAQAAVEYIEQNRHLLPTGTTRTSLGVAGEDALGGRRLEART